ncbi:hypothetical protein C8R44DRAFT_905027 [Mycena epipterygia]|nr:hypothetical protein C8R44DRAFT_905027 [Mycena epipterygia]
MNPMAMHIMPLLPNLRRFECRRSDRPGPEITLCLSPSLVSVSLDTDFTSSESTDIFLHILSADAPHALGNHASPVLSLCKIFGSLKSIDLRRIQGAMTATTFVEIGSLPLLRSFTSDMDGWQNIDLESIASGSIFRALTHLDITASATQLRKNIPVLLLLIGATSMHSLAVACAAQLEIRSMACTYDDFLTRDGINKIQTANVVQYSPALRALNVRLSPDHLPVISTTPALTNNSMPWQVVDLHLLALHLDRMFPNVATITGEGYGNKWTEHGAGTAVVTFGEPTRCVQIRPPLRRNSAPSTFHTIPSSSESRERTALLAARGSPEKLDQIKSLIEGTSRDELIVFLPVLYANLDPAHIPSGDQLDIPATFTGGAVLGAFFCVESIFSMILRIPIPPDAFPDLWRLWKWVQFFDAYRDHLPDYGLIGPAFLNFTSGFAEWAEAKDLMCSIPGFRRMLARAWGDLLTARNPMRIAIGFHALTTILFLDMKIASHEHVEEFIVGAGGSLSDLALLVVGYIDSLRQGDDPKAITLKKR